MRISSSSETYECWFRLILVEVEPQGHEPRYDRTQTLPPILSQAGGSV